MMFHFLGLLCVMNSFPALIESISRPNETQPELARVTSKIISQSASVYKQLNKRQTRLKSRKANTSRTLKLGVFVDEIVYRNLHSFYADDGQINDVVLGLINQIQAVYYQKSLGQKVTLNVVRLEVFKKQPKEFQTADVEAFEILTQFCKYQNKKKSKVNQWDMGIYFTGQDLFVESNGQRSRGTMGLSTIEGVCKPEYSCVIGEFTSVASGDQPYLSSGFMAAYIMAHEMGHNLGMLHDGYGNECPKDGFLMSATRGFEGEVRWSECSAKTIRDLHCLKGKKREKNKRSKSTKDHMKFHLVPGQTWDANDQCRLLLNDGEAKLNASLLSDICKSIKCVTRKRVGHFYAGPALDGTYCGHNKWCKSGECVSNTDKGLRILVGNWSDWVTGPCTSGCIHKSKGTVRRSRHCINPKPLNSEFCEGVDTVVKLCDDSSICESKRNSSIYEASKRCKEYSKIRSDISAEGGQMPFNKKKTWQSCAVFCRTKTTGVWYTPRYDLRETHLPDGTWCHNDGQHNYYCLHHDCIPESKFNSFTNTK